MYILCKPISRAFFTRSGARLPTEAEPGNCRSSLSRAIDHAGGYHPRISLSFKLHCQTSLAQLQLQSLHWRHNLFLLLFVFFEPIKRGSG